MKYALLLYGSRSSGEDGNERERELDPAIATVLAQPAVADWTRLHDADSATTVRCERGRTLLTDGPFLDTREYVGGIVVVDSPDLDGALRIAEQLQQTRPAVVIEVRPVLQAA